MKKVTPGFLGYSSSSGWRLFGKVCSVWLCLCFGFQKMTTAQQGNKAPAAVKGLSLEIPGLPSNPLDIVWDRLPLLKGDRITVFEGVENKTAFNHHPTIFYYKDKFFATWSNGDKDEDFSMQRVMFATSTDGYKWSKAMNMTGSIPERAYTPCGFWVREGELFALASLSDSRASSLDSRDNRMMLSYRWNAATSTFEYSGTVARGFYGIEGPRQVADGQWFMFGKPDTKAVPADSIMQFARGGKNAMDAWSIKPIPDNEIAHDISWYALPDGNLLAVEAKGNVPDRRLVSMYSNDNGSSWSAPERSNFPDADSRLYGMRLSNGRYVLLNNPNLSRYRVPLSIALSTDGKKYDRMANIRIEQTNKKYSGHAKAPGYQYMRAFEHAGKLWIIYSVDKENIEITTVSLEEIERFYAVDQTYDSRKPSVEIIIDNNEKGFETNSPWPTDTAAGIFDGVRLGYHGRDYSYMKNSKTMTAGWAKWTPEITRPGVYAVYMKWATTGFGSKSAMADIAPIEIRHPGGVHRSSVDQSRYGGTWMYLGSFTMKAGDDSYVKIYSGKNGTTVADAVKFVMMK
ncbi:MAG: exo-alpha-sialidase [Bacteroidota bacterium]